jgi:hypothetical protein
MFVCAETDSGHPVENLSTDKSSSRLAFPSHPSQSVSQYVDLIGCVTLFTCCCCRLAVVFLLPIKSPDGVATTVWRVGTTLDVPTRYSGCQRTVTRCAAGGTPCWRRCPLPLSPPPRRDQCCNDRCLWLVANSVRRPTVSASLPPKFCFRLFNQSPVIHNMLYLQ